MLILPCKKVLRTILTALAALAWINIYAQTPVIEDGGVSISKTELTESLKYFPAGMVSSSMDSEARLSLVDQLLMNKKIEQAAKTIFSQQDSPDDYWEQKLFLRNQLVGFYLNKYKQAIEVPDLTEIAAQHYQVYKMTNFPVEKRKSSHILIACDEPCEDAEKRNQAESILAQLHDGGDFNELAKQHSDDSNSAVNNGQIPVLFTENQPGVAPGFLSALFQIEKTGEYSGIAQTRVGYHIIRLDEIEIDPVQTFDEYKKTAIGQLAEEYKRLQVGLHRSSFSLDEDNVNVDINAINQVFDEYEPVGSVAN